MKCPLLIIARRGLESQFARPLDDCLKEECAVWDKENGVCGVRGIQLAIEFVAETLGNIRDNMPHEEQFRK